MNTPVREGETIGGVPYHAESALSSAQVLKVQMCALRPRASDVIRRPGAAAPLPFPLSEGGRSETRRRPSISLMRSLRSFHSRVIPP